MHLPAPRKQFEEYMTKMEIHQEGEMLHLSAAHVPKKSILDTSYATLYVYLYVAQRLSHSNTSTLEFWKCTVKLFPAAQRELIS